MNRNNKGFTLFELLVVISIIGILLGLGVVAFSAAQQRGRDARRREDMDALQKALEQYYALNNGSYVADPGYTSGSLTISGTTIMQQFPTDPKPSTYSYSTSNLTVDSYCYCAEMEVGGGNYANDNCSGTGTDYYCVSARQ